MPEIIDEDADVIRRLEGFGLTKKEARVYLALLPHRDIGSSKLIRATGLHGQFVYDALEKLEGLGLSRHVIQKGRKKFSANTPNRILSLIDERRLSARVTIQELLGRFSGAHEQDFEVFQGESAFVANEFATVKTASEGTRTDVIGGPNVHYMSPFEEEAEEYERIRKERNIVVRYIGAESQRDELVKQEKERPLWTYRIFPGHAAGIVNTDIWHDSIHLNIFGTPLLSFVLKSKLVAEGYREFFEALWSLSKK